MLNKLLDKPVSTKTENKIYVGITILLISSSFLITGWKMFLGMFLFTWSVKVSNLIKR